MAGGAYITDEDAASHLNLDLSTEGIDDRTLEIQAKVTAAEAIVIDYMKYEGTAWTYTTVPAVVRAATLLVLGALWDDREGAGALSALMGPGGTVALLLARRRDPALA